MTEPTEPRTTRSDVRQVGCPDYPMVPVPADWPVGTPVVVSTVPPDGLWPGPDGTFFGTSKAAKAEFPDGQYRCRDGGHWYWLASIGEDNGWVQCRPVPAPEPATERVPWAEAVDNRDEARYVYDHPRGPVGTIYGADFSVSPGCVRNAVGDRICDIDDDGMVTVLRDADPTGPPSECEFGCTAEKGTTECRVHDPAPSVVPADSPDTGRPSDNRWLLDDDDEPWFNRAGDYRVYRLSDLDDDDDGCVEAKAALVALVRRDRPQPTAEQVAVIEAAIDAKKAFETEWLERLWKAVDACRTTEGTGE